MKLRREAVAIRPLLQFAVRAGLKLLIFLLAAAVILNPDLYRAWKQVRHVIRPESLIDTNFAGLAQINRDLDDLVSRHGRHFPEVKLVERYVYKKIRYVSDYENWRNIEYWPGAGEVWERRAEDCDGRAILAASILRSRGYSSARLVVGLRHMWIEVNENEKRRSRPERVAALMDPEPEMRIEIRADERPDHIVQVAKTLIRPTAFRDTGTHVIADIPPVRKMLIFLVLLALCFHPCRSLPGALSVSVAGLAAIQVLNLWRPSHGMSWELVLGIALALASVLGALGMNRSMRRMRSGEVAA